MKLPQPERYQAGLFVIANILKKKRYSMLLLGLYPIILWIFVYVTNIPLFTHILLTDALSATEKAGFLIGSLVNVFANISDPLALSIVIFSLFATVNIVVLVYALWRRRAVGTSGKGAAVVALIGSHCVACGGSLLAPIITAISGSGTYISATRADTTLLIVLLINIVAIALITHATMSAAHKTTLNSLDATH